MDGGFGCELLALVYDLEVVDNHLYLSGVLGDNYHCEEWRMPARWNGNSWEKIGDALVHIQWSSLTSYRGELYSNNPFFGYDGSWLMKWNGSQWDSIPGGANGPLYHMMEHEDYLYCAGSFSECGGQPANLVFRYDGEHIEPLVESFDDWCYGYAMAFYNDTLFVGGNFQDYNREVYALASVHNNQVHRVGQGLPPSCNLSALEVHNGVLWLGGYISPGVIGPDSYTLAYYDGHSITPSPWQPDGRVKALKSYRNELYIAGRFAYIQDKEAHGLAKINDFGYFSLNTDSLFRHDGTFGSYSFNIVNDLEIWNDTLYLAGAFGRIGDHENLNGIAKLNRALSADAESNINSVVIYPNPTNNFITLETDRFFNQDAEVICYDASGRLLFRQTWPFGERQYRLNLRHLTAGLYFVTVETEQGVESHRIIKSE
jgi:hypothetical protein